MYINNVENLAAANLLITYASDVLSASSVQLGDITAGWSDFENLGTAGEVRWGGYTLSAATGSGTLIEITFTVIGDPGDSTDLL
ncbi:MAG: cohesin domain-containing protein, partial [Bacteroidales bacterium]